MTDLPPDITVKFRRRMRRCDLRQGLDLVIVTFNELLKTDLDFESALEELTKLFTVHLRRVSSADIAQALRTAVQPQQDRHAPIVELFCLLELAKERSRKTSTIPQLLLGAVCVLPKTNTQAPNIILRKLYRRALDLDVKSNDPRTALMRESLREQYATLLAQDERPEVIQQSLRLYEQTIDALEKLRKEGVDGAENAYATCLNNFAQTLRERRYGDRTVDLQKAIQLFDTCRDIPARRESPGAYTMTVQSRTAAVNELVQHLEDNTTKVECLQQAVEIAESALERVDKHDGHDSSGYDLTKLRADLWLAWANATFLLLDASKQSASNPTKIEEQLRIHCEAAIGKLDELVPLLGSAALASLERFRAYLGGEPPVMNSDDIEAHLHEALTRVTNEQQAIDERDAYLLRRVMLSMEDQGIPSPKAWEDLQNLLNAIHPLAIGPTPTRQVFIAESSLLASLCTSQPEMAGEHIRNAVDSTLHRIDEPQWAETHRRVFAYRVRALSRVLLDSDISLQPAERLWLHDLQHAQAFRGDLEFFGRGNIEHHGDDGQSYGEGQWRLDMYRTRVEFDRVANVRYLEDLIALHPEMANELRFALEFARIKGNVPAPEQKQTSRITNPAAEASNIRDELIHRLREGKRHRWPPADDCSSPRSSPSELKSWLRDHPNTGVFVTSQATCDLYVTDGNEIDHDPLLSLLSPSQIDDIDAALDFYLNALATFSNGEDTRQSPDADDFEVFFDSIDLSPPSGPTDKARGHLDLALETLLDSLRPIGVGLRETAQSADLSCLVISSHGRFDPIPWESIPVDASDSLRLADKLDVVRLYTLDHLKQTSADDGDQLFTYLGVEPDSSDPLSLGYVISTDETLATTGLSREEFDRHAMNADVIRLLTHAQYAPDPLISSFLLGDDPEEIVSSPPGTERLNAFEAQAHRRWFSAMELLPLDLRGCERVELWACESARSLDLYGALLDDDEPIGLAAPFLKAGASRVLGSWWKQPIAPAILIAQHFVSEATAHTGTFDDARLLANAVAAYRRAVQPKGIFSNAVHEYAETNIDDADDADTLRREAIWHGWSTTYEAFADRPTPAFARDAFGSAYLGGFRNDSHTDPLLDAIRDDLHDRVDDWLKIWRGPTSWAGWRIIARDRSTLSQQGTKLP